MAPPMGTTAGVLQHEHAHEVPEVQKIAVNVLWSGTNHDGSLFTSGEDFDISREAVEAVTIARGFPKDRWNGQDVADAVAAIVGISITLPQPKPVVAQETASVDGANPTNAVAPTTGVVQPGQAGVVPGDAK